MYEWDIESVPNEAQRVAIVDKGKEKRREICSLILFQKINIQELPRIKEEKTCKRRHQNQTTDKRENSLS